MVREMMREVSERADCGVGKEDEKNGKKGGNGEKGKNSGKNDAKAEKKDVKKDGGGGNDKVPCRLQLTPSLVQAYMI